MVTWDKNTGSKDAADPYLLFSSRPDLPELKQALPLPAMFEDSTHQLWRCKTDNGEMMLKICQHKDLALSSCWQVIAQLFGCYLPDDLGHMGATQRLLEQKGQLDLPELIACESQTQSMPAFWLSRYVSGNMLTQTQITDSMVQQLAAHIAALHSHKLEHWGKLDNPAGKADVWPEQLLKTLVRQCAAQQIAEPWLSLAVSQIEQITPSEFVPIMLDNRWDQYLFDDERITALVDIDAFVAGPCELELVLLEYQLDDRQARLFAETYQRQVAMPDLSRVRLSYRLLLFLMNALGEADLDKWMQAAVKW